MKKNSLKLTALALILTGFFSSCTVDNLTDNEDNPTPNPTEILIEDYSLYGSMCSWSNRRNDGKVVIINSDNEMQEYVSCYMNSDYHAIDFSKHSLLLAGGVASSGIYSILEKSIQHVSSNKYELNVVISLNEITEPLEWDIAVRITKLSSDAGIELKVNELPAGVTSIIGKWKLMKEQTSGFGFPVTEFDYSQHNIVYEFKANGVLTVSGNVNAGFPGIGTYSYSIGNHGEINIHNILFWYSFVSDNEELIIDHRPLDGSAFYFAKFE